MPKTEGPQKSGWNRLSSVFSVMFRVRCVRVAILGPNSYLWLPKSRRSWMMRRSMHHKNNQLRSRASSRATHPASIQTLPSILKPVALAILNQKLFRASRLHSSNRNKKIKIQILKEEALKMSQIFQNSRIRISSQVYRSRRPYSPLNKKVKMLQSHHNKKKAKSLSRKINQYNRNVSQSPPRSKDKINQKKQML